MKRKISRFSVLLLAVSIFVAMPAAAINTFTIPDIQIWQEIHFGQGSNNDSKDERAIYIRWYQEPNRADYKGMIAYHKTSVGDIPFIKAWNFRNASNSGYDFTETFVALLLDDGSWCVGDKSERLKAHREYNDKGKTTSVEYRFDGQHSSVSKKINLQ